MRIQHNIMAMNAYRNYTNNTSALSKNLEKLSSGYKINRAGDDAAGLAISEKMRAQITGLETAQKNAKDGISLVQTAEGALTEVHDMLNRMVELADQSANGTYDNDVDRANLQKEMEQLKSEINRIADSSNFNGIKLLNGNLSDGGTIAAQGIEIPGLTVTAGTTSTSYVAPEFEVSLDGMNITSTANSAGQVVINVGGQSIALKWSAASVGAAVTLGALSLSNGTTITVGGVTYNVSYAGGKLSFTTAMTAGQVTTGMDLNPDFTVSIGAASKGTVGGSINTGTQVIKVGQEEKDGKQGSASFAVTIDMLQDGASIKIGNETYAISFTASYATGSKTIGVKDLLNSKGELENDDIATVVSRITKAAANNGDFTVGNDGTNLTLQVKTNATNKANLVTAEQIKGAISISTGGGSGSPLVLQIGDTTDSYNQLTVSVQDMHTSTLGIEDVDIGTQAGAKTAVDKIREAINTVSSVRGTLGATQNRLDHTINNLSVMTENIQDAESTIRDTDVAEEMMAYTKNNILVQSAQAMLAQANQVPQGVLQLLQ